MPDNAADEQDLAKALDNVAGAAANSSTPSEPAKSDSDLSFEATPSVSLSTPSDLPPVIPPDSPVAPSLVPPPMPDSPFGNPVKTDDTDNDAVDNGPLADIKKDALEELRPLVDKLSVSPEEKFDTYLLLIRSTDDTNLIGPAHEAAKAIEDESRRAEALLDIIKEIDYLSQHKKTD